MYAIVLEFNVIEGMDKEFIKYWDETTIYFRDNCNSLGSRLHKSQDGLYVAYARWPNREVYEKAHEHSESCDARTKMRKTLKFGKPQIIYQMNIESDFLI